jgi:hypothetical protein
MDVVGQIRHVMPSAPAAPGISVRVVSQADWTTFSALATAAGTLVLAIATFVSVRSANRAARVAERALLAGLRPVLMQSRPNDPEEKIGFIDGHWTRVPGGGASAEVGDDGSIYLVMSLRNVGSGIAVLHSWDPKPDFEPATDPPRPVEQFRRLTRDMYIASGDSGLWQGAMRDSDDPARAELQLRIDRRERFAVDLLYGDHEGGQRTISRYSVMPRGDEGWMCTVVRHWNLDRADPR